MNLTRHVPLANVRFIALFAGVVLTVEFVVRFVLIALGTAEDSGLVRH